MEFPKTITILGRKYSLKIEENLKNDKEEPAGGLLQVNELELSVDPDQPGHRFWPALYHEVVHIALDVSGADQKISEELVEVICQSVGNAFYDLTVSVTPKNPAKKKCRRK